MANLRREFLAKVLDEVARTREEDVVGIADDLCGSAEALCSMATELMDRQDRHDLVVDHAKDEYYHRGRRDLAFELAADWNEVTEADEFGGHLETVKTREVEAYTKHPRSRKAEAH